MKTTIAGGELTFVRGTDIPLIYEREYCRIIPPDCSPEFTVQAMLLMDELIIKNVVKMTERLYQLIKQLIGLARIPEEENFVQLALKALDQNRQPILFFFMNQSTAY